MRIVTNLLAVFFLLGVLAQPAWARTPTCAAIKPIKTNIQIVLVPAEPYYDYNETRETLPQNGPEQHKDWLKENSLQELWTADGDTALTMATGGWGVVYDTSLVYAPVNNIIPIKYCGLFEALQLELFYRTRITIPRDFKHGSCEFNVLNKHMLSHHEMTLFAMEGYVARLQQDIKSMIEAAETEPVLEEELEAKFDEMEAALNKSVERYFNNFIGGSLKVIHANADKPEERQALYAQLQACKDAE